MNADVQGTSTLWTMEFNVRPAHESDLGPVAAFTADTFEWGDYVSDNFHSWLSDPAGLVLVAVDTSDTPIGLGRALMLSTTEAWLHAARVHPLHRRQGIGSALDRQARAWARQQGAQFARLLIEDWNRAARQQVMKLGYRPTAPWIRLDRSATTPRPDPFTNGGKRVPGDERLAPAASAEAEPAWIAWLSSDLARVGRLLYPLGWYLRRMTLEDVTGAARRRGLWQCPSGWAIAEMHDSELFISWVVTSDLDASRLVRSVVDKAENTDGVEHVGALVPGVTWLVEAFEKAGFESNPCTVYGLVP